MKHTFWLLFLLPLLAVDCGHERNSDPDPIYYLDQEMYDYTIFPVGSWWVYEEESSGFRDSVAIVGVNRNFASNSRIVEYSYELMTSNLHSSMFGKGWSQSSALRKGLDGYCFYIGNFDDNIISSSNYKFLSSVAKGNILNPSQGVFLRKSDFFDSYDVNNTTFKKVKTFEVLDKFSQEIVTKYFYAKTIGLIRKENHETNKVWNLVDYHINH